MIEEEKEAIKFFYNFRATIDESNMLFDEDINVKCGKETVKQITTLLNLIQKQQDELEKLKIDKQEAWNEWNDLEQSSYGEEKKLKSELEKKNKIIDLMAKEINKKTSEKYKIKHICEDGKCGYEECHEDDWNECIKQYFEKKVEDK